MFNMNATTPALKCSCGASINMLANLKVRLKNHIKNPFQTLSDLGEKAEEANVHLEKQQLEKAHTIFNSYLGNLDKLLLPPYQDYYKVQQNVWKLAWMRWGNKMVTTRRMGVPTPVATELD